MSQVINTNIASLTAQRNLNSSQSALQTSLERLSSGLRINSAKDDAAGLAISERFSAQISGLAQAQRNSNDGISFAQTAEGGLDEIGNLLQRVRELSVQAANDSNSNSDRQALNQEVEQAIAEINRIANSTQFNNQNVLDGTLQDLIFQVGANAGQTISVDGVDARGGRLGAVVESTTGFSQIEVGREPETLTVPEIDIDFTDVDAGESSITVNGETIDISGFTFDGTTTAASLAADIQADIDAQVAGGNEDLAGITVSAVDGQLVFESTRDGQVVVDIDLQDNGQDELFAFDGTIEVGDPISLADYFASGETVTFEIEVNGTAVTVEDASSLNDVISAINAETGSTGVQANLTADGRDLVFSANRGEDFDVSIRADVSGDGDNEVEVDVEATAADNTVSLNQLNVATRDSANEAMVVVDFAIDQINTLRADLGAVQSRFESTIANLSVGSENLSAARSRIVDADFAAETAELTRAQILQQAGTSVLAQANQIPQNVLSLLQ